MGMKEPKFEKEGYAYIGEDEQWHIREDAPDWAKKEFETFMKEADPDPNADGLVIQY